MKDSYRAFDAKMRQEISGGLHHLKRFVDSGGRYRDIGKLCDWFGLKNSQLWYALKQAGCAAHHHKEGQRKIYDIPVVLDCLARWSGNYGFARLKD